MAEPIVLSLCDRTGNMVRPWLDAGPHDRPDTGKECHYLAVTMPHGGLFCNKCGWAEGAEDRGQTDG